MKKLSLFLLLAVFASSELNSASEENGAEEFIENTPQIYAAVSSQGGTRSEQMDKISNRIRRAASKRARRKAERERRERLNLIPSNSNRPPLKRLLFTK